MRFVTCLLSLLVLMAPAYAVQPDEVLPDAAMENRAREISTGLRCLVCQNESIDDSDAPLARDLRILVRDRLKAGDSDAEVKAYVVDRYGEFVLLKPVFGMHTILLWLGPVIVFLCGLAAVLRFYAARQEQIAETLKTEEEELLLQMLSKNRAHIPEIKDRNKLH